MMLGLGSAHALGLERQTERDLGEGGPLQESQTRADSARVYSVLFVLALANVDCIGKFLKMTFKNLFKFR